MFIMGYNSTLNCLTGFILHFSIFGRSPTLPLAGILCSAKDTVSENIDEYVKDQKDKLLACFDIALQEGSI